MFSGLPCAFCVFECATARLNENGGGKWKRGRLTVTPPAFPYDTHDLYGPAQQYVYSTESWSLSGQFKARYIALGTAARTAMSSFSSLFSSKLLASMTPRDRPSDPLSRLRFALETMPGSRKYVFTPATRAEILSELYDAFWGPYAHLFLPNSNSSLPLHATLSEVQTSLGFAGAGQEEPVIAGRPCGHIFKKGESCFRCK